MANIQLDDLINAGYCRNVFVVQSMTRVDDKAQAVTITSRFLDALQFCLLLVAVRFRVLPGM